MRDGARRRRRTDLGDTMRLHRLMRAAHVALVAPIVLCVAPSSSFAGEEPPAKSRIEREFDETVAKLRTWLNDNYPEFVYNS